MHNNALPFRSDGEKMPVAPSAQSRVYEFVDAKTGDAWVRKEMGKLPSSLEKRSAESIAGDKLKLLELMKEYIGEYLPETYYAVSKNSNGEPTVQIVQKKIHGKTLAQIEEDNEWEPEFTDARQDIRDKVMKLMSDKRAQELPDLYRIVEAFSVTENIMIDENKRVWVVDW